MLKVNLWAQNMAGTPLGPSCLPCLAGAQALGGQGTARLTPVGGVGFWVNLGDLGGSTGEECNTVLGDRGVDGLAEADGAQGQVGHVQPQVVHLPPLCVQRWGGGKGGGSRG